MALAASSSSRMAVKPAPTPNRASGDHKGGERRLTENQIIPGQVLPVWNADEGRAGPNGIDAASPPVRLIALLATH